MCLDENGNELVRVDWDGQQARLISPDQLQNKADRPYFQETMKLAAGEVYLSPVDLNAVDRFALDTEQLLSTAMQISGGASRSDCGPQNVEEIAAAVQRACHEAGLSADHCTLCYAATGLPRLDLTTLELILRQLLDNARKNHPQQKPQVQIVGCDDAAGGVRLEVEDDGPGIPPELQDQVWLPFYQIDRWQTGQTPGMGMGLAIVANHVWTAGGCCWIERGVRGGARICLTLPAAA
ncbi:MAG: ATP-binding protein [Chloroflexi bacterium]|nr:ATP-binding protein [Chloroflexota bacterium]